MSATRTNCPSCGNVLQKNELRCKFCGYEQINKNGFGKSRLSDAELVKGMDNYSKRGKKFLLSSVPVLLTAIILIRVTGEEFSAFTAVGIVFTILFLVLLGLGVLSFNTATEMFKVNVVHDTLAGIIDGCVYKSKQSISKDQINNTKLVSGWNKFNGEDYIKGTYKGRMIEFSDIHLKRVTGGRKGNKKIKTIFKGHWLICGLAKELPAVVRLSEGSGENNAETENIAFNNKYSIFTDDPHHMFYVLTPHFMEYIIAADEAANVRTYFCFEGEKVHIAVDSRRNTFEVRSADKNNPEMARERIKKEMTYITDILDELLQNNYLFGDE
jgi:hypothetical protein